VTPHPPAQGERPDVLLLVAIKTDQPNIQRRIQTILAASEPIEPDTQPCVYAKAVGELTDVDLDALAHFMEWRGVGGLRIGTVDATPSSHD
jgi:hypothetical protein